MFTPKALSACPVCKAPVSSLQEPPTCSNCGANLAPYLDLYSKANSLYFEALDACSKLDFRTVQDLKQRMLQTNPNFQEEAIILDALTQLHQHCYEEAFRIASSLPTSHPARQDILSEIELGYSRELKGKQHFNLALSSARKGLWADANFHIEAAIRIIPYLPEPWRLAVKIALASGEFHLAERRLEEARKYGIRDAFIETAEKTLKR